MGRFLLICVLGLLAIAPNRTAVNRTAIASSASTAQDDQILAASAAAAIEEALVEAIASAERSIVAIARVRKGTVADPTDPRFVPNKFGSGVIIDDQGHILTNYHVLGDPDENDYFVWVQKRPYRAVQIERAEAVRAADPWTDLAVLRIDGTNLEPIRFGDGENLRKGQLVIALGNPYSIARDGEASASWGMIANLTRKLTHRSTSADSDQDSDHSLHQYGTLIQTDAKLELGTSGGALINLKGEMIGLTTSLAAMDQYETSAGFAIPVDSTFRDTVEKLKRGELVEYGFLGVSPRDLDVSDRRRGDQGVTVAQVVEGTPAAYAGIKFGDLITHINGEPIRDSAEFMRELGRLSVGSNVVVSISRQQIGVDEVQRLQLPLTLSKKFIEGTLPAYSENKPELWRGMLVDYATAIPRFSERSRFVDEEGCVAILAVERGSLAWEAGLRPRDFISHVGDKRVSRPDEFHSAVENAGSREVEVLLTHAPRGQSPRKSIAAP